MLNDANVAWMEELQSDPDYCVLQTGSLRGPPPLSFISPNDRSVITYFPSPWRVIWASVIGGGTCGRRRRHLGLYRTPRRSTKGRDSIMRRQLEASSKKASEEKKRRLVFIWPHLPDPLPVSLV